MNNVKILIQPESVFNYFLDNKQRLKDKMEIIAESDTDDLDRKCFLYLTNENGDLFLSLEAPDIIIDSERCYTKIETELSVKNFLCELEKLIDSE